MNDSNKPKHTNALVHETSPYLLQHAHNPVDWYAWNDETLKKAKKEHKPILVSIGYSACHWCHVMEHECFEDDTVADLMNKHFICIKVDREERPDIDQVYMNAVQLMTGSGGWPLNCFAMPDGRPIYGGTYFPKTKWLNVLKSVADVYENHPEKAEEYADKLTEGVQRSELVTFNTDSQLFSFDSLVNCVENWQKRFDNKEGGPDKAPKFPMPNNYLFLLRYAHLAAIPKESKEKLMEHVNLTLKKMAYGGIYDQVGGGFSRYSTDYLWKVPHFEKMLYDNAQLVSLYSEAFQNDKNPLYKNVVDETLDFIERELTSPEGMFYSALDADSEGEEGKYYVWKQEELQQVLGKDFPLMADYFNINAEGFWEHGNYILLRKKDDDEIAKQHNISIDILHATVQNSRKKLLAFREKRIRPGLDDKSLTSWNALMIKGYADAYAAFQEPRFLKVALKNANLILQKQGRADGGLNHSYKDGRSTINGYLEDYAFTIEAFISLYQVNFDEKWLNEANKLAEYTLQHFHDKTSAMFYFTSDLDPALIARKTEVSDNVTPASNSSMAISLFLLSHYFANEKFLSFSKQMLNNVKSFIGNYGPGYSNWAMLMLDNTAPFYEIAIVGNSVDEKRIELSQHYIPNKIFAGSKSLSVLPLLENRLVDGKTLIYVCENKVCRLPVSEAKEALEQLK